MSPEPAPLSKTAKYKKITKPLLERKRRARINRCLDELKDLMVGALEIDDDNLSKLEKADILELTVNHLTKLHSPKDPVLEVKKFQAGFGQCAAEACRFIMSVPDLDTKVSQNLISHLSRLITAQPLTVQVPERPSFSPPTSPLSVVSDRPHYYSDQDRSSSDAEDSIYSGDSVPKQWAYNSPNPRQRRSSPPVGGLLTTVDRVPHNTEQISAANGHRNGGYYNRQLPAEAKDVILQKIRQHIMDKRGNENYSNEMNVNEYPTEPKYLHKEEQYRHELAYHYSSVNANTGNGTLDLRKVRSPTKPTVDNHLPKRPHSELTYQSDATPIVEKKVEPVPPAPILPDHCESPMDYSNLPPKKKRKLIEYQEYKKQEEARRQRDAFCNEQKEAQTPADVDADGNKWRPW